MTDVTEPHHLPKRRAGGAGDPQELWPKQRRGVTPQMIGRYPDFDVLAAADSWDEATRRVVFARLRPPGPFRFFAGEQVDTLRAFCDVALAQDREPRVPVAEAVDAKLAEGRLDGYQYADMPDDRDTWRRVLAGLDEVAAHRHGRRFPRCSADDQHDIVEDFAQGRLAGGSWQDLNVRRAWSVVMRAVLEGFYSHPWSWNEIGFGGPAYPRGFMRLGPTSTLEPFETPGATNEDPTRVAAQLEQWRAARGRQET